MFSSMSKNVASHIDWIARCVPVTEDATSQNIFCLSDQGCNWLDKIDSRTYCDSIRGPIFQNDRGSSQFGLLE
jgi:hypothetical protein